MDPLNPEMHINPNPHFVETEIIQPGQTGYVDEPHNGQVQVMEETHHNNSMNESDTPAFDLSNLKVAIHSTDMSENMILFIIEK